MHTLFELMNEKHQVIFRTYLYMDARHMSRSEVKTCVNIARESQGKFSVVNKRVRVTLDLWESTLFWYWVLHRPIKFDDRHPKYGGREWTVFELIHTPGGKQDLQQTDLGIFFDEEHDWIVLFWPEAIEGICAGLEEFKPWKVSVNRTGCSALPAARNSGFAVDGGIFERKRCRTRCAFYYGETADEDFTAMQLTGIDIPKWNMELNAPFSDIPPIRDVKSAAFVHLYTKSKKEYYFYRSVERDIDAQERYRKQRQTGHLALLRKDESRKAQRRQKREQVLAARAVLRQVTLSIQQITRFLGVPGRSGRPPKYLSLTASRALFNQSVEAYINGEIMSPRWERINLCVAELRELLEKNDAYAPAKYYDDWLLWGENGKGVRARYEKG